MRIAYLAAGAGAQFCGACARDVNLALRLRALGHEVLLAPLYTPLEVDGPDPSDKHVFYGGLHTYLEQKWSLFRRRLPLVDRLLDSRWLLRAVSHFAIDTRPEDLGAMTVSVLRGPEGRQAKELGELLDFLERDVRPEVVNLTNSLLSAIAPEVKRRLGVPVVCTLQGEEAFVARLGAPHSARAVELLRLNAAAVDLFVAPSADYAEEMAVFLNVPRARFRVVRPGVDISAYEPAGQGGAAAKPLRVGCLSRISPAKGTDLLCAAFARAAGERPGRAVLALAGQLSAAHERWWRDVESNLQSRSRGAPGAPGFDFRGEVSFQEKLAFLRSLDVFVQASRIVERRGMAALEALASGVPVVLPRRGIFVELVELTGGGLLVEPDSVEALAAALVRLLDDAAGRARMSRAARAGVERHYSAERMAEETLRVYEGLARR